MDNKEVTWIETFTGKRINPMHLDEEMIDINDIAHSLALQCRFVGHCIVFYSIAEHSMRVAELLHKMLTGNADDMDIGAEATAKTCLAALLHDAAEAYIGDISRPVKHHPMFKFAIELEKQILGKIMKKFNCTGANWELIKKADDIMLATEAEYLMADSGKGWYLPELPLPHRPKLIAPEDVEPMFLYRFEKYGGKQ